MLVLLLAPVLALAAPAADPSAHIERFEKGLRPPVVVEGEPAWTLAERMRHYRVPGVSVAVIDGFELAWEKAYGVADARSGQPVTAATLFQAASISKPVTATMALKLVEEGKLTLDRPINDVLTTWKLPENEHTRKQAVTLQQLLSHTAGTTASGFPGYVPGDPLPTLVQILDGAPPANTSPVRIDKTPGESFRYSGGGTTVVQIALQDVTGQPFASLMKSRLLDPLGLKDATFELPLRDRPERAAAGHGAGGDPIVGLRHTYPEQAAAGLWTTPADLARLGIAMQLSLAGRPGGYLKPETARRMVTVVTPPAGLGFFVDAFGWTGWFMHAGGNEGFTCILMLHRERGAGAAIMTNSENGPDLIREMLRSLAREYGWDGSDVQVHQRFAPAPGRLAALAGRYVLGSDTAVTLTPVRDRLVMREALREDVDLVPIAEDTFVRSDRRTRYRFEGEQLVEGDGNERRSARRAASIKRVPSELLAAGEVEAARQAYETLLKARADDPDLSRERLDQRGLDLLWRGEIAPAKALLEMAAGLWPASALAQDALADFAVVRRDEAAAAQAYRRAIALIAQDPEASRLGDWGRYVWRKRAEALEAQR